MIGRIAVAARSGADDHAGNGGTAMRGSAKDLPHYSRYPLLRTNDVNVTKMFRATGIAADAASIPTDRASIYGPWLSTIAYDQVDSLNPAYFVVATVLD